MRTLWSSLDSGIVHTFSDERHFIPHLLQLVIEMGTQKTSLSLQLLDISSLLHILHGFQSTVATGDSTIELIPQLVEFTTVGLQGRENLHGVITCIVFTRTALQTVIGTHIAVWPQIEGIGIPVIAQFGVCSGDQFVRAGERRFFIERTLRLHVIHATRHCKDRKQQRCNIYINLFHCSFNS